MKKKSTYKWLCIFGGIIGLHKYYLEEYGKGIWYSFSFGGFLFGWLKDIGHMSGDVDRYNAIRGFIRTSN